MTDPAITPLTNPVPTQADPATVPSTPAAPATAPITLRAKESRSQVPLPETTPTTALEDQSSTGVGESESTGSKTETPAETSVSGGSTEAERRKELEPEIEKAVEKIKNTERQKPNETVVVSDTAPATPPNTVAQPVIILPLTKEGMQTAKNKDVKTSVRWLYQWCVRQVQKFSDIIIVYRKKSGDET